MWKSSKNPLIKKNYSTLQSNNTQYSKPFKFTSWSSFLEGHHILIPEIWGKTFTDWFKKFSDGYVFSMRHKIIYLPPLKPAMHRMSNAPNILWPRCKERELSHSHFIFYCKIYKNILDFISELTNLNYPFNIPFKISLKAIRMGGSSELLDDVQLKILPIFLEVFLRHLSYWRRQAFHDNAYAKIDYFFSFKYILVSQFNKFRNTATELDWKKTFLNTWYSLLNNNGNLNIQFS